MTDRRATSHQAQQAQALPAAGTSSSTFARRGAGSRLSGSGSGSGGVTTKGQGQTVMRTSNNGRRRHISLGSTGARTRMTVGNEQQIQQRQQLQDGGWSSHSDYSSGADEEGNMDYVEDVGAVLVTGPAASASYGGGAFGSGGVEAVDEAAAAAASAEFDNVQSNDVAEEQDEDEAEQQLAAQALAAREQGGSGGDGGGGGRGGGGVGSQERAWLEFELQRIQEAAAASAALRASVEKEKMEMLTELVLKEEQLAVLKSLPHQARLSSAELQARREQEQSFALLSDEEIAQQRFQRSEEGCAIAVDKYCQEAVDSVLQMRLDSCAVRAAREVSVTDPAHPLYDSIQRHLGAILARKRLQLKHKQAEVEAKKKRVEQESAELQRQIAQLPEKKKELAALQDEVQRMQDSAAEARARNAARREVVELWEQWHAATEQQGGGGGGGGGDLLAGTVPPPEKLKQDPKFQSALQHAEQQWKNYMNEDPSTRPSKQELERDVARMEQEYAEARQRLRDKEAHLAQLKASKAPPQQGPAMAGQAGTAQQQVVAQAPQQAPSMATSARPVALSSAMPAANYNQRPPPAHLRPSPVVQQQQLQQQSQQRPTPMLNMGGGMGQMQTQQQLPHQQQPQQPMSYPHVQQPMGPPQPRMAPFYNQQQQQQQRQQHLQQLVITETHTQQHATVPRAGMMLPPGAQPQQHPRMQGSMVGSSSGQQQQQMQPQQFVMGRPAQAPQQQAQFWNASNMGRGAQQYHR